MISIPLLFQHRSYKHVGHCEFPSICLFLPLTRPAPYHPWRPQSRDLLRIRPADRRGTTTSRHNYLPKLTTIELPRSLRKRRIQQHSIPPINPQLHDPRRRHLARRRSLIIIIQPRKIPSPLRNPQRRHLNLPSLSSKPRATPPGSPT